MTKTEIVCTKKIDPTVCVMFSCTNDMNTCVGEYQLLKYNYCCMKWPSVLHKYCYIAYWKWCPYMSS